MKAYVVANINEETRKLVLEIFRNEDAILDPEKVAVYLFTKEGKIEEVRRDHVIDSE